MAAHAKLRTFFLAGLVGSLAASIAVACIDVDGLRGGEDSDAATRTDADVDAARDVQASDVVDSGPPPCGPRFDDCFSSACENPDATVPVCAVSLLAQDEGLPLEVAAADGMIYFNSLGTLPDAGVLSDQGKIVACPRTGCSGSGNRRELAYGLSEPTKLALGYDGIYFAVAPSTTPGASRYVARCPRTTGCAAGVPTRISPDLPLAGMSIAVSATAAYFFAQDAGAFALFQCATSTCLGGATKVYGGLVEPLNVALVGARAVVTDYGSPPTRADGQVIVISLEVATFGQQVAAFALPAASALAANGNGFVVSGGGADTDAGAAEVWSFASTDAPLNGVKLSSQAKAFRPIFIGADGPRVVFTDTASYVNIASLDGGTPYAIRGIGDIHGFAMDDKAFYFANKGGLLLGFRDGRIVAMPK